MGYDITGIKPTSKHGEYIRFNVWNFKPLWNLVTFWCQNVLTEKEIEAGYYNDGHKYSKETAQKMYLLLGQMLRETKKFKPLIDTLKKKWTYKQADGKMYTYPFTWQNVKDFRRFLKDCNGFEIW